MVCPKRGLNPFDVRACTPHAVFDQGPAVERLAGARTLNAVNQRALLKKYRKLALELHPDRCDHALAVLITEVHRRKSPFYGPKGFRVVPNLSRTTPGSRS